MSVLVGPLSRVVVKSSAGEDVELSANDFDNDVRCSVCLDFLCNPVTVDPCGHTFCRECLRESLARRNSCPDCRSVVRGAVKSLKLRSQARAAAQAEKSAQQFSEYEANERKETPLPVTHGPPGEPLVPLSFIVAVRFLKGMIESIPAQTVAILMDSDITEVRLSLTKQGTTQYTVHKTVSLRGETTNEPEFTERDLFGYMTEFMISAQLLFTPQRNENRIFSFALLFENCPEDQPIHDMIARNEREAKLYITDILRIFLWMNSAPDTEVSTFSLFTTTKLEVEVLRQTLM